MKISAIYVMCFQRMLFAISNDVIEEDVVSPPLQCFSTGATALHPLILRGGVLKVLTVAGEKTFLLIFGFVLRVRF